MSMESENETGRRLRTRMSCRPSGRAGAGESGSDPSVRKTKMVMKAARSMCIAGPDGARKAAVTKI